MRGVSNVNVRLASSNPYLMALLPATLLVAGCGGSFSLAPGVGKSLLLAHEVVGAASAPVVSATAQPVAVQTSSTLQWTATFPDGISAEVRWSVTGGDPGSGAGSITAGGMYTAPAWLTQDIARVTLHARFPGSDADAATALLTITPGFIRPLSPENLALGAGATATFSASIAEVGGSASVRFALPAGDFGSLSTPICTRGSLSSDNPSYTACSVTYTAPAGIAATESVVLRAAVSSPTSTDTATVLASSEAAAAVSTAQLLLNPQGVSSNPATHQQALAFPVTLGSSAGSNTDYDSAHGQLADCCGGTLGALVADASGNQYVLSNNHILARSDQAIPGETIIQPGLIDNGCTPYGEGPGATPIASLVAYPPLEAPATRVDAALARAIPGTVDSTGAILDMGPRQPDGMLAAAPPGVSSTAGRGESPRLGLTVAKSGRTTGLTCGAITALDTEILVDYYRDCAETKHAFRKRFTGQIVASGASFADAGDSGALLVDSTNAEPVGLFFAGGEDDHGIEQAIANPAGDVLGDLSRALGSVPLRFVGAADHPVACLRYPDNEFRSSALPVSARASADRALELARQWASAADPRQGLVPRLVPSADQIAPDSSALSAIHFDAPVPASLPRFFGGLPTQVDASSATAAAMPDAAALARAMRVRDRRSAALFAMSSAIFGLGVGQSANNPTDPALIVFVDRNQAAPALPASIDGERVRIIRMDRPHVTRGHGQPAVHGCRPLIAQPASVLPFAKERPLTLPGSQP